MIICVTPSTMVPYCPRQRHLFIFSQSDQYLSVHGKDGDSCGKLTINVDGDGDGCVVGRRGGGWGWGEGWVGATVTGRLILSNLCTK